MGFEPALWIVVVASVFNVIADFAGFYENGLYTPLGLRVAPKEERGQEVFCFSSNCNEYAQYGLSSALCHSSWPTFLLASCLLKRRHIFGGISYHAVSNTDFSQSSDGATIENSRAAKPDREESERAGDFCFFQTSGLGAAQDT